MSIGVYLEIVCFLTALVCLFKVNDNAWRGMIIYMFITCAAEITGYTLRKAHQHNQWVYNIQLLAEATFNSFLFGSILKQYIKSGPLIIGGLALIYLIYLFDLIKDGFFVFNDLTATVMSVIFVVYSFYYYFLLIKDERHTDLMCSAPFWWITGSLFYYFGSTAINLFYGFLNPMRLNGHSIAFYINIALSALLYGCWIYSFICKRWLQTSLET